MISERHEAVDGLVVSDPGILGGTPVFRGTRVPVRTLFEYLAADLSLDYFLETFPTVTREQALSVHVTATGMKEAAPHDVVELKTGTN